MFGKSLSIPGQILGHPGAPLSNLQTRALLEQLYKLAARPPVETSTVVDSIDLAWTEKAKFVYVKVEDPAPLAPRFEGPYVTVNRPSRSTVTVRLRSFVDGSPRLQTYNWNTCKIAHLREDAVPGERPRLGRKPKQPPNPLVSSDSPTNNDSKSASGDVPNSTDQYKQTRGRQRGRTKNAKPPSDNHETSSPERRHPSPSVKMGGKIQTDVPPPNVSPSFETLSGTQPHPNYLKKGPVITNEMFDKWTPDLLGIQPRPVRSTRNPQPKYIDAVFPA